ncbi:MAG: hypothetical protein ACK4SY_06050 [Pyrobaculum sp.]
MRFALGILINAVAFILMGLGIPLAAIVAYVASLVLLLTPRRKPARREVEVKREVTPEEVKKRPAAVPEI